MTDDQIKHIGICHRCPQLGIDSGHGSPPCARSGRHFVEHVQAGDCPQGYFTDPPGWFYHASVQRDKWPLLIRAIATQAIDTDQGVGDTFKRVAGYFGGERYKKWMAKHDRSCGCQARQDAWNKLYPYSHDMTAGACKIRPDEPALSGD